MRLANRTYSILDIPLSPAEFWLGVAFCGAVALGILFVLRPVLSAIVNLGGWR